MSNSAGEVKWTENTDQLRLPLPDKDHVMSLSQDYTDEDAELVELLFESNASVRQIALSLDWTQAQTSKRIKELGLGWVKRNNRKLSRGHAALTTMVRKLLPGVEVVNEYHLGERLFLDIYCPKYNLGIEFHGRQHFYFTPHFHKDRSDFEMGVERDERKARLCERKGITLVVFCYNEKLTEDDVFNRILHAIRTTPKAEDVSDVKYKSKSTLAFKGNPIYEEGKRRRKEWEKEARQKIKMERQQKYG